jgi:hypothetical protein
MKRALLLLALVSPWGMAQEKTETRELVGQLGNRSALLILHAAQRKDDSWQIAGEYLILPSMVRRYLEGERSPQLGLTSLKEGNSAILFGRPATGELRGTWRDGVRLDGWLQRAAALRGGRGPLQRDAGVRGAGRPAPVARLAVEARPERT